jgi:hypothetical protein
MAFPNYSISGDFPSGVATDRLQAEINDSAVAPVCTSVNTHDGVCTVIFDDTLDAGEIAIVDALVAAHSGTPLPQWETVHVPTILRAIESGASEVVANDRPAIEVQDGFTAFGAASFPWRSEPRTTVRVHAHFILKSAGTGSTVRLAARVKAQAVGEDSSSAFTPEGFAAIAVTHTTVGEVFEGLIDLDASGIAIGDSVAVHVGRDGDNEMSGGGGSDDVDVPIQIIDLQVEVA